MKHFGCDTPFSGSRMRNEVVLVTSKIVNEKWRWVDKKWHSFKSAEQGKPPMTMIFISSI